jgi:Flp pilus assembly pilin Flp
MTGRLTKSAKMGPAEGSPGLACLVRGESGQGVAEYALILFFVAAVVATVLVALGGQISSLLSQVVDAF